MSVSIEVSIKREFTIYPLTETWPACVQLLIQIMLPLVCQVAINLGVTLPFNNLVSCLFKKLLLLF